MRPRLVLASTSPYRARLLARLGMPFATDAPGVDETRLPGESPEGMVLRLSETKASVVAACQPGAIVIASDQTGVLGDTVLSKPLTRAAACGQLRAASGREVVFLTGLCVVDTRSGIRRAGVERCTVRFRRLGEAEIEDYVAREQPLDCAGSFKVEGLGIALFRGLELGDPTALEGLPLIRLCEYLAELGAPVLGA
jgi:septum formation protein